MAKNINDTLQAKFPHLEIAILPLSQAMKDNESKRIDSEYFKKEYLENEKKLKNLSIKCDKLENFISKMTGGATPLGADYPESGIPFLRVQNIMQNYFNLNDIVYISKYDDEALKRSRLKFNDMLFTITGAYGKAAVVENDLVGANINQHSVKIETKDINPYFLATFLNSEYGQLQCNKKVVGVTRPALDYQTIKTFLIPIFPQSFQQEIQDLVKDSHKALEQSKVLYKEAQNELLNALDFTYIEASAKTLNDKISEQNIEAKFLHLNLSIRALSQSYGKSARLDSEYYQRKYDENETIIKRAGYVKLGDLVSIQKSIEPGSEAYQSQSENGIEFVRVANLTKFGISKSDIYLNKTEFSDNLAKLSPKKDTILLSKDGSIGISYCVMQDLPCITSGAILHLHIKDKGVMLPQVLSLILNSDITKLQAERDAGGSIIAHWKIDEIKNVLIPKISQRVQENIADKITQSFALRKQSKDLLESAKAKVESAVINS